MRDILARIADAPIVLDGAMGTMIYSRGVFINTCYDELCLTKAELVAEIHREYVAAGADVIETNSFGANCVRLGEFGLADRAADICRSAARIARDVAGDDVFVAGSVGPCLDAGQLWTESRVPELEDAFEEQIAALLDGGADFILLETFAHVEELRLAARIAKAAGGAVFASFTAGSSGETALGVPVEVVVSTLHADDNVDAIGMNCGTGPAPLYDALQRALPLTGKPVIAMPNAGTPKQVGGRMLFLTSPEYFTSYAKKYVELGVRGVGGCCGTTPEHIRVAAKAVKALSSVKKHVQLRVFEPSVTEVAVVPVEQKSRFACRMAAGGKVTTIELLPPRSADLTSLLQKARMCHYHGIDAINIPDGPRASSRVSPMIAALTIQREVGIEPILHYCCRDRNLIGMQSDLLGGYAAGLRNFLIITGDPPKLGDYPDATGVFDVDAIGLTRVARNLNHGRDIGGTPIDPPTGLFIGVGANPCAVSPELEQSRFRSKVEAGAEFAITQPIFDPQALFRFLDSVADSAIPVVAGVWPLVSYKNAEFMRNEVPGVEVPDSIMERMATCRTREEGVETGIAIAQEICAEIRSRVAGFQVSAPFGKVEIALRVLDHV